MTALKISLTALILAVLVAGGVTASEDVAKKEGLACTACHDKPGSKLLTDQGKYYELMGSLDGYAEVEASFERCTSCHVRKPGSLKLTKKGEMFAFLVDDMEGLREWVTSEHPGWPYAEPEEKPDDDDVEPEDDVENPR